MFPRCAKIYISIYKLIDNLFLLPLWWSSIISLMITFSQYISYNQSLLKILDQSLSVSIYLTISHYWIFLIDNFHSVYIFICIYLTVYPILRGAIAGRVWQCQGGYFGTLTFAMFPERYPKRAVGYTTVCRTNRSRNSFHALRCRVCSASGPDSKQ